MCRKKGIHEGGINLITTLETQIWSQEKVKHLLPWPPASCGMKHQSLAFNADSGREMEGEKQGWLSNPMPALAISTAALLLLTAGILLLRDTDTTWSQVGPGSKAASSTMEGKHDTSRGNGKILPWKPNPGSANPTWLRSLENWGVQRFPIASFTLA